ncbi:probable inactive ATP-dependent zinc metalloprotease FTSHI 2, chloroplastic [Telopea speciosissima]|uniref:probable inactive ATP-dependent zinc metalloprotease FTSHI 2, chloroplastic n=1 Tax=Telopea speciosissima TaxID=54955 RepID=UPI001CC5D3F2|nr:probable inactive ATP-dependent zinc metalloprotease FTSHI 2, chloroplastic [Telopea speciosissima]XP_043720540.1 probable inactive ATP-dependent zinc metalloprotease FTSHI 2, chloroplastic [Telopea speciosissima]XP_043720541.1 probable inactive ATP-dependent zinc metalloprotease FTSHI 2, chloroplastic [Telopea speciosissima]
MDGLKLGCLRFSYLPSRDIPFYRRSRSSFYIPSQVYCHSKSTEEQNEESKKKNGLNLLQYSVTLTVISSSLPQAHAATKVSEKKRSAKKMEALSPEELKSWSQGLPIVTDRIPYTEILNLKEEGKLKHIVKLSTSSLKQRPDTVLVVLDDSRVVRTVLPSVQSDGRFWESWDKLQMDSVCVNAYTPPIKKPEIPSPYLGFLSKIPLSIFSRLKPKPQSKRALEFQTFRKEMQKRKTEELARLREEREMMEKTIKAQKKIEKKNRRKELKKIKYEESLLRARKDYQYMASVWAGLARDQNVSTALGVLFFYIFYRTVVLNYRKQQKDYEDRMKIEKAEAEERKKMKQLEKELQGDEVEGDENEEGTDEKDLYLKMAKQFMRSGARVRRARNKRLPQYLDRGADVKFSDVAGLGKIRLELEEIVKFFTHGEMYRRRGVRIPGGILLCGPPGVGKTLLAKAVAGEAGVNFFSISASQFVEIYVGVGASRVRSLYQEARENAPAVVFIDELDAVGRERGLIKGSGGQERDATLNQLLVCLDGFEGRGDVITIAATNRPDILDAALVRPGRFDRKIYIPKPGLIGRIEILQVHARKKPMAEDVDYMAVASITEGMVGAELANIVEIAAINMMRDGRSEITTDDLLQAAQIEERGLLDRKERSPEMWKQLALNEVAMAVVAVNFPDLKNIEFVTIAPRAGRELGYVRVKMDHMKFKEGMLSRQSLLDHITVQLAPRAADEIYYGEDQLSTIWSETADNARSAARTLVLGGLSEKHYGLSDFWVADRLNEIDLEALRILNMCYERAKEILMRNRKLMDAVVDELIQKKNLSKQDFFRLVEVHGSLEPVSPNIIDIRITKRMQFQEMMMNKKGADEGSSA